MQFQGQAIRVKEKCHFLFGVAIQPNRFTFNSHLCKFFHRNLLLFHSRKRWLPHDESQLISLSVRLPILYVPCLPKHYCRQFQKYHHDADHLWYHKNRKSTDQHLKCFPPLATAASRTKGPPLPVAHCPADRKSMQNSDAEILQTTLPAIQQGSAGGLSSPVSILTAIESLS